MKNMFKLAAIAVSMALVTSLVACSSSDDDVVDTSTAEYLAKAQIAKYVDSLTYCENVTDAEIKKLKEANDAVVAKISDCADCLEAYCGLLRDGIEGEKSKELDDAIRNLIFSANMGLFDIVDGVVDYVDGDDITLVKLNYYIKYLDILKGADEKKFHRLYVYKPAIKDALDDVNEAIYDAAVDHIDIKDGKLNDRQAASIQACIDAVKALKAALSEDDTKTCKSAIEAADKAIKDFGELEKVTKAGIDKVIDAAEDLADAVYDKVYDVLKEDLKKWNASFDKLDEDYFPSLIKK